MRLFSGLRRLLAAEAVLLALGLLATALPTQAQTAGHNSSSRRDYYYPQTRDPYRSAPSEPNLAAPSSSTTIVRPVIIDNRIQNSTVIGPVIVSPQTTRGVPAGSYSTQPQPSQPRRRTDAACMAFNELRLACQL